MLFWLSQYRHVWFPLNVFQYITFRTGAAFLTALLIMLFFGGPFVELVKRWRITQSIREYGPQTHLKKAGTPTMGGLIILLAMMCSSLLWARLDNRFIILVLLSSVYLGALGFIDDFQKMAAKHPKGLSKGWKIFFQLVWALSVTTYLYMDPPSQPHATTVQVPYLKDTFLQLNSMIILFGMIALIGASNAVNLTDGLDGLACGTLVISGLAYIVFAYLAGNAKLASYLRLVPVPGAGELAVFLGAMTGACLGFLWFNGYPADIFMGDTGSLFLGGTIGLVAVTIKQEIILIIVGGIFVAEAVSVLLQVGSIRMFNRKIFKMSPLHHHFELLGWPETKVTLRFWIVAVVLALVAFTSLKLR